MAYYRKTLDLTNNRYSSGIAARVDVLQAETQLKSSQAQMIDLGVQRAQLEHAIAVLIGKPAAEFSLTALPLTSAPPAIPLALPSELLERRPDIASAERHMAAANAQIGIAQAAYYPTVKLGASLGLESSDIAKWLAWPSRFWSVGPAVSQTVFDGGLRKSENAQAMAAYDGSVASYRQTVLSAFRDVEDNLAALRILAEENTVQDQAVEAAAQTVRITLNQYQSGVVGYLNVISAPGRRTCQPENSHRDSGPAHERCRAADQGAGWRLGSGSCGSEIIQNAFEPRSTRRTQRKSEKLQSVGRQLSSSVREKDVVCHYQLSPCAPSLRVIQLPFMELKSVRSEPVEGGRLTTIGKTGGRGNSFLRPICILQHTSKRHGSNALKAATFLKNHPKAASSTIPAWWSPMPAMLTLSSLIHGRCLPAV